MRRMRSPRRPSGVRTPVGEGEGECKGWILMQEGPLVQVPPLLLEGGGREGGRDGKPSGGHTPRTQALRLRPLPVPDPAKRYTAGSDGALGAPQSTRVGSDSALPPLRWCRKPTTGSGKASAAAPERAAGGGAAARCRGPTTIEGPMRHRTPCGPALPPEGSLGQRVAGPWDAQCWRFVLSTVRGMCWNSNGGGSKEKGGGPPGEGGALKLVWCNSNFVSGISVGIALCVLPE